MISARDALNSIERADLNLRREEDRLAKILTATNKATAQLRGEQAQLFRALAAVRLDAIRQDQVVGALDAAESRAKALLDKQQRKLEALADRRAALQAEIAKARAAREAIADSVAKTAEAIAAREEATEARMAGDVEWQAQSARLLGAQMRAEAAEDKASRSEADRDEKSKPYLADALFVYLWKRRYGTSQYSAGPITRLGDGYVARVINYEPARQNYFSLTEIPKRLREHADRLKAVAEEEERTLVALERAGLEDDGITALESAHDQASEELQSADTLIAGLEADDARLESERNALLSDDGEHGLGEVVSGLAASMQGEDLRVLLREALETPSPEDEKIVHQLQAIEDALKQQENQAREAREAAAIAARKRAEIERSRKDFRQSGYERQGGGFGNEALIGDILGGIIGGALSSRELRDAFRSGYRPSGSRSSQPSRPKTRGGFGGGRRSGGFKTGGGSSGGGFRTGGGF